MPQSTVRMPTPEARIGPMVEPHPISFRTTNSYTKAIQYVFPMSQVKDPGTKTRCAWHTTCC